MEPNFHLARLYGILLYQEPNDYDFTRPAGCTSWGTPDCDGKEDGSEDYGHFNLGGNGKLLNDYPNDNGGFIFLVRI